MESEYLHAIPTSNDDIFIGHMITSIQGESKPGDIFRT